MMDKRTQELLDRTFLFSCSMIKFLYPLSKDQLLSHLVSQLVRSATAIGANYEEAQAAESKRDFAHKIAIVCKECRETHYWLRIFVEFVDADRKVGLTEFIKEVTEFKKIFTSIRLSSQSK